EFIQLFFRLHSLRLLAQAHYGKEVLNVL
ncbi:hypothetical protein, partial [Klebsiella pneumoniae]